MDMEKAGPSTRNPERQLPNKRKRYSSKFFCFRRKVPLTQFWTKKPRKAKKTCWWEKCMSFLVRCFIRRVQCSSHVMYTGLFVAREQKRKNWNVIHPTFPFAKAIITWTVHRHVYFTAECWQSVGQSVRRSVSFQPLYRLTESQTLKSDAHLII